jgi:hypothetical protein
MTPIQRHNYTTGNWGPNRQDRDMKGYELTTHIGGNTLGLIFAIPTCGVSLVCSMFSSIIIDGINNGIYNSQTGY